MLGNRKSERPAGGQNAPRRCAIIVLLTAILTFFTSHNASADICWNSGITPEGHSYRVLYVPSEAITIAASGQRHNYRVLAVAFQGWIWADASVPCRIIPWQHEMKHLDGWSHDANQRWTDKQEVPFTEGDRPRAPWTVVKTENDYRVIKGSEFAALPDSVD